MPSLKKRILQIHAPDQAQSLLLFVQGLQVDTQHQGRALSPALVVSVGLVMTPAHPLHVLVVVGVVAPGASCMGEKERPPSLLPSHWRSQAPVRICFEVFRPQFSRPPFSLPLPGGFCTAEKQSLPSLLSSHSPSHVPVRSYFEASHWLSPSAFSLPQSTHLRLFSVHDLLALTLAL